MPTRRSLTRCSNGLKLVTAGAREDDGGSVEAIAFATVFLEIHNCLAICACGNRSLA